MKTDRLFNRDDRPLPPKGCSWAFYLFLLVTILVLLISYFHYKQA